MSIWHFESFFAPRSVALIGASDKPRSVGRVLLENMKSSGYRGQIWPVNPKHGELAGLTCYASVSALPDVPELAVLCVAAARVPATIAELGERGVRAAIVISAGFGETATAEGRALEAALREAASVHKMRIIGPNCVGVMVPGIGLNASFSHLSPARGRLAFVSQSGALCTAILDNVAGRGVGFSHFVSLGNALDVDFGDMLDYLANDAETSAILLYIESVSHVRKFISAGRAASRNKPVIVIKSGRNQAGARAAASHTGALIGSDAVYDAAFRRAGMLRVYDMEELFDAVETLARVTGRAEPLRPFQSSSEGALMIVSNGGGPAVLATDQLTACGGKLAELSPATLQTLNALLPATWSHANPVDMIGDADAARYRSAMDAVFDQPDVDAVLAMKCPTAVSDNLEAARAVIEAYEACRLRGSAPLLLTCWLGEATVHPSRRAFADAGIATYDTPEKAVRAFLHIEEYRRNERIVREVPRQAVIGKLPDRSSAETVMRQARQEGRELLFDHEAKQVLAAYHVPVLPSRVVLNADEAVHAAEELGYPVALKLLSPQITHKSDVGGVVLNVNDAAGIVQAIDIINRNVTRLRPDAQVAGFSVQPMLNTKGYELIVGAMTDNQFGPVILFGEGGVAVEVLDDKALGLPPLNANLAADMIRSTRVFKRLAGYRDRKPVDFLALTNIIIAISQLVIDFPAIRELDINPLTCDENGVIALDVRIRIGTGTESVIPRLAVSSYPQWQEQHVMLSTGQGLLIRPVRPEDGIALGRLMAKLTPEDLFHRFHGEYPVLIPEQAARISQIDYDREIVLVAVDDESEKTGQHSDIYGCIQCTMRPGSAEAEFAIMIRSDMHGIGIGSSLTSSLLHILPRVPGISSLRGVARASNQRIAELLLALGFSQQLASEGGYTVFRLPIHASQNATAA